jgi:hypothetical protein
MTATVNMLSPTSITNSIPRPQSPRRVASRNSSRNNNNNNNNNNARIHTASLEEDGAADQPTVRRRAHGEMGHFGKAALSCVAPGLLVDNKAVMCVDNSLDQGVEYTEKYAPVAKRNFTAFASNTKDYTTDAANRYAPKAKEAAVDFAETAAEAYRLECKSDNNRGGDELFFANPSSTIPNEDHVNSLLAGLAGSNNDSDSIFEEKKETDSVAEESSVNLNGNDDAQPGRPQVIRHIQIDPVIPSARRPATRFPNTNDLMAKPESMTPPRVSRSSYRDDFAPSSSSAPKKNLRATRMELFHQAQTSEMSSPETRLSRALQDLDRQDQMIDSLKRQMQMTQSELDEMGTKLDDVKQSAQERQFKATETQAKAIQERKRMEDRYQNEAAQTKLLQEIIAQLQVEISSLKVAVRGKDKEGFSPYGVRGEPLPSASSWENPSSSGGETVRGKDKEGFSPYGVRGEPLPSASSWENPSSSGGEIISMRLEIVELRSQLAEAHAANIDDSASVKTFEELDDLKNELRETEAELKEIKEKEQNYQKLQEQLFLMEYSSNETKSKLENRLKKASSTEIDLRSELSKTKASLQRLEREKSRKRLHSTADQERVNKQLEAAKEEVAKLKEHLGYDKATTSDEIENLTNALEEVKQKLSLATRETAQLKTEELYERRKTDESMAKQTETIKTLQQHIHSKDEKMITHVRQIAELNGLLSDKGFDSNAHLKKITSLDKAIKNLEANEASLQQELQLQKNLLKEEREEATKFQAARASVDNDSVWQLKERMERVKSSGDEMPNPNGEVDARGGEVALRKEINDLKREISRLEKNQSSESVKEEILLKEIADLKSRLRQAEGRGREEKLRSQEERRMSRENTTGHDKELERLKQERNETLAAKNEMEKELVELRKRLVVATQKHVAAATAQARDSVGSEVSSNVLRLRNEMGLARARLATAREHTRAYDGDSISTKTSARHHALPQSPPSPGGSHISQGSSWAPPIVERQHHVVSPQADGAKIPDLPKENPVPLPSATATPDSSFETKLAAPKVVVAPKISTPNVITPEKSGRDYLQSRTQMANSFIAPSAAPSTSSNLQRKLEESRRRLDKANSKLVSLLGPRTTQDGTYGPLRSVVVVGEEMADGVIDEVFSSPSGSIEITQRSYGDI